MAGEDRRERGERVGRGCGWGGVGVVEQGPGDMLSAGPPGESHKLLSQRSMTGLRSKCESLIHTASASFRRLFYSLIYCHFDFSAPQERKELKKKKKEPTWRQCGQLGQR